MCECEPAYILFVLGGKQQLRQHLNLPPPQLVRGR